MNLTIRHFLTACIFIFTLTACNDDKSVSSSDGGTQAGDGGAESAQYAGTYIGNMKISYSGDDVSGSDTFPTTLIINRNGTVSLTAEGEDSVDGVIGGHEISVVLRVTQAKNGVSCEGDAIIQATVNSNALSGPISGQASCKALLAKRDAQLTGTINASKTN